MKQQSIDYHIAKDRAGIPKYLIDKIRSEGRELPQSKLYQAKQARNR